MTPIAKPFSPRTFVLPVLAALALLAASAGLPDPASAGVTKKGARPVSREKAPAGRCGKMISGQVTVSVCAPEGWTLDEKAGMLQGLNIVVYPEKTTWDNAPVAMYVSGVDKKTSRGGSVAEVMASDAEDFGKGSGGEILFSDEPPVKLKGGGKALLRRYTPEKSDGAHEMMAYIDEPELVVFLVLTSKSKTDLDGAVKNFREFVGSYKSAVRK